MQEVIVNGNSINVGLTLNIKPLDEVIVGGNIIPQKRKAEITRIQFE